MFATVPLLDLLRAFAPHLLALVIAGWGLRAYRHQRRIDRQVDWYQRISRELQLVSQHFAWAGHAREAGSDDDLWRNTRVGVARLTALNQLLGEAALYATKDDLVTVEVLQRRLYRHHKEFVAANGVVTKEFGFALSDTCAEAATRLAESFRRVLLHENLDLAAVAAAANKQEPPVE